MAFPVLREPIRKSAVDFYEEIPVMKMFSNLTYGKALIGWCLFWGVSSLTVLQAAASWLTPLADAVASVFPAVTRFADASPDPAFTRGFYALQWLLHPFLLLFLVRHPTLVGGEPKVKGLKLLGMLPVGLAMHYMFIHLLGLQDTVIVAAEEYGRAKVFIGLLTGGPMSIGIAGGGMFFIMATWLAGLLRATRYLKRSSSIH